MEDDKDRRCRNRINTCKEQVGRLLYMIVGDDGYLSRNWERRIELVKRAIEQLENPQLVLKRLKLLMEPIILAQENSGYDVGKVESALEEIQSFLLQSKDILSPPDSVPLHNGVVEVDAKALHMKEELQSFGESLKQISAIAEQKNQLISKARVYTIVAKMLQKVVNSCSKIAAYDILNLDCANQVQEFHGVSPATFEIERELLRLDFPQTSDSIPIDQERLWGKYSVKHFLQEMIVREKQVKEVTLIIGLVGGRLAELKLEMKKTNEEMGTDFEVDSINGGVPDGLSHAKILDLLAPENWDNLTRNICMEDSTVVKAVTDWDGAGTSNAMAKEVKVTLSSSDETCSIKGYKVFHCNAGALTEVFEQHPDVDEKFRVAHPDAQSFHMNSLAEVYRKIMINNKIMLEPKDIKDMELLVQDMELTGLQVTWLKKKLEEVHEVSENQAERKRLVEEINNNKAKVKEAKKKLAKLEKKPRFL